MAAQVGPGRNPKLLVFSCTGSNFICFQKYYVSLAKQLAQKKKRQEIGVNLSPELFDCFNDEQIAQLTELHKEATTVRTDSGDS